jgi:NAD(P)-dependent dehydrogenase (short-subunit alcohol dehydrogenase family)
MLLEDKTAVIYGAGGAVGGAIARTFAREGARLYLTGRHADNVEAVAKEVEAAGGTAETAQVDALDEQGVDDHLDMVIDKAGQVDISFNAIGLLNTTLQGTALVDLDVERFMAPISAHVQGNFVTARLAGRRMTEQGSGVIMTVTSIPSRVAIPLMGGVAVAMAAEEALIRGLSVELAPHGVRALGIRPQGMPDSATMDDVFGAHGKAYGLSIEEFANVMAERTHPRRLTTLQEMADVAAFAASDRASAMTGTILNLSLGTITD